MRLFESFSFVQIGDHLVGGDLDQIPILPSFQLSGRALAHRKQVLLPVVERIGVRQQLRQCVDIVAGRGGRFRTQSRIVTFVANFGEGGG